jgi:hypothetical protein
MAINWKAIGSSIVVFVILMVFLYVLSALISKSAIAKFGYVTDYYSKLLSLVSFISLFLAPLVAGLLSVYLAKVQTISDGAVHGLMTGVLGGAIYGLGQILAVLKAFERGLGSNVLILFYFLSIFSVMGLVGGVIGAGLKKVTNYLKHKQT